jgi:hypothetical protein
VNVPAECVKVVNTFKVPVVDANVPPANVKVRTVKFVDPASTTPDGLLIYRLESVPPLPVIV